jgi:hypothetical protein
MKDMFYWIGVGAVLGSILSTVMGFIKYLTSMRSDIDYQKIVNKDLWNEISRLQDKHHNLLNDLDKRFKEINS